MARARPRRASGSGLRRALLATAAGALLAGGAPVGPAPPAAASEAGLAVAVPADTDRARLRAAVRLEDVSASRLRVLLGAAPEREVVLRVTNVGDRPATNPRYRVYAGRGVPTEKLVVPPLGVIEQGGTVEVRTRIRLDAPAIGTYAVDVVFGEPGGPDVVSARTWTFPWLGAALACLVVGMPLLGLRRRRPAGSAGPAQAPAAPSSAEVTSEGVVSGASWSDSSTS